MGLVGWVLAGIANSRAKKANRLAEVANEIAADAVRQAGESNNTAQHANGLSEQANTIAQRQAAQQADPSHIEWEAKFDSEASVLRVTNRGRDAAVNTSVIFERDGVEELVRGDDLIPRGGELLIPFPEIPERREKHRSDRTADRDRGGRDGIFVMTLPFGFTVSLDVRWVSELGKPGQQTVQCLVR